MVWILFALVVILISILVSDNEKEAERKIARQIAKQKLDEQYEFTHTSFNGDKIKHISRIDQYPVLNQSKDTIVTEEMTSIEFTKEYELLLSQFQNILVDFHIKVLSSPKHLTNADLIMNNARNLRCIYENKCTYEIWRPIGCYEDRLAHMKKLIFDFKNNVENLLN
jgi:hypothetical protein